MEKFKISGKVVDKQGVVEAANGFRKQVVVVDTAFEGAKYPNPVPFTFKKENIELQADRMKVGDKVTVTFCADGRRWDSGNGVKYFLDLTGLEVEVDEAAYPEEKPKTASNWKELVALGKAFGEDEEKVKERCKGHGKAFAEMKESDWKWLAAAIVAEHDKPAAAVAEVADDIPF